ncbi:MAG: HAMP domain-containing sensor histidine kinase [Chloroflexota bacterium]
MNPTLRTRIFLSYIFLIGLAAVFVTVVSNRHRRDVVEDGFYEGFDEKANLATGTAEDLFVELLEDEIEDESFIFRELQEIADDLNIQIMLLELDGETVFFDSERGVGDYFLPESEDVAHLIEQNEPLDYENEEDGRISRATFVSFDDEPAYIVRVIESQEPLTVSLRNQSFLLTAVTLIIAALILLALGAFLANGLTRPLTQLRQSAQAMAAGKLDTRANTQAPPEISLLAEDFNQMATAVEDMVAEQRAFASNAAHELRTPLTAIRIRTETLLEDDPDAELRQRYISEIDAEAKRLSRLVNDLRMLSRADARNLATGSERIDLVQLVRGMEQLFDGQIKEKQLNYVPQLPQGPCFVQASVTHLRIIVRNIIENAIKYTPEQGIIAVSLQPTGSHLHFEVRDNGMGIAAEDLPQLFNRFYRVDKAHSRKIPGSGLGLSLVSSIVNLYDGTVTVTSDGAGMGTTVQVLLPIAQ